MLHGRTRCLPLEHTPKPYLAATCVGKEAHLLLHAITVGVLRSRASSATFLLYESPSCARAVVCISTFACTCVHGWERPSSVCIRIIVRHALALPDWPTSQCAGARVTERVSAAGFPPCGVPARILRKRVKLPPALRSRDPSTARHTLRPRDSARLTHVTKVNQMTRLTYLNHSFPVIQPHAQP